MLRIVLIVMWVSALMAAAQEPAAPARPAGNYQAADGSYILRAGTRIPLTVMSTVSSKNAAPGDQLYLQTLMPVAVNRRIIIPAGTYVIGSVTQTKRPGKVSGRGELSVKFDSMMLPNGVTVDLAGRLGAMDGGNPGELDRTEGKVKSDGSVGRDAMIVGGTTVGGTGMGSWIGDHSGTAAGIGAAAGAATGLAAVLLTRGPEASLERGATVEMLLNRDMRLAEDEVDSAPGTPPRPSGPKPKAAEPARMPLGIPRGIPRW